MFDEEKESACCRRLGVIGAAAYILMWLCALFGILFLIAGICNYPESSGWFIAGGAMLTPSLACIACIAMQKCCQYFAEKNKLAKERQQERLAWGHRYERREQHSCCDSCDSCCGKFCEGLGNYFNRRREERRRIKEYKRQEQYQKQKLGQQKLIIDKVRASLLNISQPLEGTNESEIQKQERIIKAYERAEDSLREANGHPSQDIAKNRTCIPMRWLCGKSPPRKCHTKERTICK